MSYLSYEVNYDGIIGQTYHCSGLSVGNEASLANKGKTTNPKEAALQGLAKMKFMMDLGIKQAVLPPHERPHFPTLRLLGFTGKDERILEMVAKDAPWLLELCTSAASMWAANVATVSPSIDSIDGHVHFTPANMASKFHRFIESEMTGKLLRILFRNPVLFSHHLPLPNAFPFWDEGAANHIRFCKQYHRPGVQLFVFGQKAKETYLVKRKYPARQTEEASQAVARLNQIYPGQVVFAMQNPEAINAGVFHNDVIATGNQNFFFCHEKAFFNQSEVLQELKKKVNATCDTDLQIIEVKSNQISLENAVRSYLFNSQIVSLPNGEMHMMAPIECLEIEQVVFFLKELEQDANNPINRIHFIDLSQSMLNGGGPACLRLKVILNENELKEAYGGVFLTERLYMNLVQWVNKHYRNQLHAYDLSDPKILTEIQTALDELTRLLGLGPIYSFQK